MTWNNRLGPLFTDLYELTMAAGYHAQRVNTDATFSLFIRECIHRQYFVIAGMEDLIRELEVLRFTDEDIYYLRSLKLFSESFLNRLKHFRFTGDVLAVPEGTILFPNEPILEVTAPIIEAQLIETLVINLIGMSSLIASKAARCVHAAQGTPLVDFSLRRTQGSDAGMKVARCSFLAGFTATSNVLAGKVYGIPVTGTMAHSFITTFDDELDAFRAYAEVFPNNSVFLIDTYDTEKGARNAVVVALEMRKNGKNLSGVRLDSGDMAELSIKVRKILDDAGLTDVNILASSGFDEYKISEVIKKGAKIDGFGVGTKMGVSADQPYFDMVYKMVRVKEQDVRKLSTGKLTLAGKKQVFRKSDRRNRMIEDTIGLREEVIKGTTPLLKPVMKKGTCICSNPSLEKIREQTNLNLSNLDDRYKSIDKPERYPVKISMDLQKVQQQIDH